MKIGIMQGRLSPPIQNKIQAFPIHFWKDEFKKAHEIGFSSIEWIFDDFKQNPIMDQNGKYQIQRISKDFDISINSCIADYFMIKKLFDCSENEIKSRLETLKILIANCSEIGIKFLEIPLVDSSSLKKSTHIQDFSSNLKKILPWAEKNKIIINLETDLPPTEFNLLLSSFESPFISANYDVGNSTSYGYDYSLEFEQIGKWIKNIHIKDRLRNGETVPLGTGDTDFGLFFSLIKKIKYSHELIIQGAREDLLNQSTLPQETCKKYFKFVQNSINC